MTRPPEKKDAKAIFSAAIEHYMPEQWEGYIVNACGNDEALRQRVRELLDAHRHSDSLFDHQRELTGGAPVSERAGTNIGPYKLLQQIGEGGFGVVYMAEQIEPVRRKVALKIIKPGMDTKQVIARFEAERQALAMMDHPNIAKVLDAGATDGGRPYFVMELVKGIPVTEFCDTNKLPTRARLDLFVTVCRAVQHAHQKGVIHRDLKPSNVMVTLHDNKPMPVIIDFGVSKAISHQLTEKTLFTAYGQMVGTPAYMSPEQAQMSRMDIDTRSDIYSLGVLLYELLTGSTPLDAKQLRGTAYAEMQRLIREEEAPKPSMRLSTLGNALAKIAQARGTDPKKLGQFLRGDLDWIVLKALEKERNRRYETANGLANDIERFLKDEAVEACPPSLTYQLRKFIGRNRGLVTTASAIAAAILLGIIGTTIGMIQARHDAERARAALLQADAARARANTLAEEKQVEAQRANTLAEEKQAEAQRALEAKQDAERLRDDAKAQVAEQLATRARMERTRGDITLAALLDAEALSRDTGEPGREANHRRRLAVDLRQSPRPTHLFFHDSTVLDARFSAGGKWIVTACEDGTVQVRDSRTGSTIQSLHHEGSVHQAVFRHDDTRLLTFENPTGSADDRTEPRQHLWDWDNGQRLVVSPERMLWNYYSDQPWRETYPSLSPDNLLQLRSTSDGQPIGSPLEYDTRTHRSLHSNGLKHVLLVTIEPVDDPPASELPEPPFGRQPTRWNSRGELWNGKTGQSKILFEQLISTSLSVPRSFFLSFKACYSEDRSSVAIQDRNHAIHIYDVDTGEQIQQLVDASNIQPNPVVIPVEFGSDNKMLMCKTTSEIVLFNITTGEVVGRRIPVKASWTNCHFCPDGSRILSINQQGYPQIWYTSTGEAASPPMEHNTAVQDVGFSGDGRFVKVVYADGMARVWDSLSGTPAAPLLKHVGGITTSSFSRDGSHLLVAAGRNVWVWPIGWPEFEQVSIRLPADSPFHSDDNLSNLPFSDSGRGTTARAQISPDGQRVVTNRISIQRSPDDPASRAVQAEIRVCESATGRETHNISFDLKNYSRTISRFMPTFSRDGRRILMVERGGATRVGREITVQTGSCRVWNLESRKVVTLESAPGYEFLNGRFTTDGRRVMTISTDGLDRPAQLGRKLRMRLWDCETGNSHGTPIEGVVTAMSWLQQASHNVGWSPDGHRIAVFEEESDRHNVLLLDTATGKPVGPALEHSGPVSQLAFCDAGRSVMTVVRNDDAVNMTIWSAATCTLQCGPLEFPTIGESAVLRSTIDPTMACVAIHTASFSRSYRDLLSPTVIIHHLDGGKRNTLPHDQGVTSVAFDSSGRYLLTTSLDNKVQIWDPARGELVRVLLPDSRRELVSARFSDDGSRIVTMSENMFQVWEVATGQPLSALLQGPNVSVRDAGAASAGLWSSAADRFLLHNDHNIVVHDLSAEQRPVDELQRMTRVLSGRRVNQLGSIETLLPDQLKEEWNRSANSLYSRLLPARTDDKWHRLQSQESNDHYAAIWHLDRLLQAEPSDGEMRLRRGQLLAAIDRHKEALADFDAALANDAIGVHFYRANSLAHLRRWGEAASDLEMVAQEMRSFPAGNPPFRGSKAFALAYLLAGELDRYELACEDLISSDGRSLDLLFTAQWTLLIPRDEEFCKRIADRIANRIPSSGQGLSISHFLQIEAHLSLLKGLLALRRGDPGKVIKQLGEDSNQSAAVDLILLAMAQQQLGETDKVTHLLALASEKMHDGVDVNDVSAPLPRAFSGQSWVTLAMAEILYREAEQMIRGESAATDSTMTDEKKRPDVDR